MTSVDISGGTSGLTSIGGPITSSGTLTLGGILNVANGGTGTTAPALTAGSNITLTGSWPNYTIAATGITSGTVTSVGVSGGSTGLSFTGGPITSSGTITASGVLAVANGGTGTASPGLVAGTNVTITGSWPNQTINSSGGGGSLTVGTTAIASGTSGYILYDNAGVLGNLSTIPVANGGTGTSTPSLVAGTNVTISGSWPNQTINASGGGGGSTTYAYAAIQYIYSSQGLFQLAGLDFQNAAGTSLVGGGTALGNGANPGNAFDGNASTDTSGGNWIGYNFTSAVAVGKVVMTASNSIFSDRTPLIYDVVVSNDGKTWKPIGKVIDTTLFANGEVRTYTIPS